MFSKKIEELLNNQVNKEFFSAYLYLSFANFYVEHGLSGFANWYQIQAQEERDHALLFVKYMQDNGIKVALKAIDQPNIVLNDNMDALKAGLEHEKYVTDLIHTIYTAADEGKDFRTKQFLDWFIKEQGEEETNAGELIKKMELFGADSRGLYLLDQELGNRTYAPPSLVL